MKKEEKKLSFNYTREKNETKRIEYLREEGGIGTYGQKKWGTNSVSYT